jgi:hypothetical protein
VEEKDNDSDAGMPDDADDLEDDLEVRGGGGGERREGVSLAVAVLSRGCLTPCVSVCLPLSLCLLSNLLSNHLPNHLSNHLITLFTISWRPGECVRWPDSPVTWKREKRLEKSYSIIYNRISYIVYRVSYIIYNRI